MSGLEVCIECALKFSQIKYDESFDYKEWITPKVIAKLLPIFQEAPPIQTTEEDNAIISMNFLEPLDMFREIYRVFLKNQIKNLCREK
jgi:hypothetical protein